MQNTIPISVDDRRFTITDWLGFLGLFTFLVFFFALHTDALSAGTVRAKPDAPRPATLSVGCQLSHRSL